MSLRVLSTVISFVRHGHVHNPQGILYGRLPRFGLSEKGHSQARVVAETLRGRPIAALYSSPMLRARQTAQAILDVRPGLPLHISELINEVQSSYEGQPLAELIASGWDLYRGSEYEQPHDVLDRALRFIDRTRKRHMGQQVVAVTHGDVIAAIICWVKRLSIHPHNRELLLSVGIPGGYPAPASISTLTFHTANRDLDYRPEFAYHALFQEHAK
ncbi:MAG: histidine phosphatase family protein [Anaerolineae bacterium]|nr:histidine phosphatase family protein [Anaerolineae bacterium]